MIKQTNQYMKRIIFIIIIHFVICGFAKAQIPQAPANLQSPNAANLGLYGEVPVSLFTGIPEISIPIFTAPTKYNGFSIGLSYHARGVLPDQHSGWVGTNWTLMAGGCISRVEKGGCDEIISDFYIGYKANSNMLNDNDLTQNNYLQYDTEPDEFSFNFGNYSGKFYFDRNKNLVVKSNKLLKVALLDGSFTVPNELKKGTPTSWIYTFKGFSIKTEDGTEYIFGGDQSKLEFNMEFWQQKTNQWYATAWYLAQIKYPNGKTIDFNYERGSLINQMYISKSNGTYNLYEKNTNGIASETLKCSGTFESGSGDDKYEGYLISPIYLTSISSPDFRIEFQSGSSYELRVSNSIYQTRLNKLIYGYFGNNGCSYQCNFLPYFGDINSAPIPNLIQSGLCWRILNYITIYNSSQPIKSYNLKYDYSNISSGDPQYNANERLFLMSILQGDGGKYNFEYYNKQLLPPYLAEKTDHWGFYNNRLAQYNRDNYYSSREPDAEAMKYGSLKKIIYPTGGSTEFEFEANQYSSQTKMNRWEGLDYYTSNRIAGGLRIKKIVNTPIFGQTPTIKEYFYSKNYSPSQPNGLSSGILGGKIQYYFDNRTANADRNLGFGSVNGRYSYSCFTTQSVLPICTNSLGNHIGYSEVVEKLPDGSYTKYKFSNFDTGNLDEIGIASIQTENPYQPYNSKEQERGNLLSKEIYDSNDIIKSSLSNNYIKSDLGYVNSIKGNSKLQQCPGELAGTYYTEATSYKIYTFAMLLDSTKTTCYDNSQTPLSQGQKYKYNAYNQVINETTHTSDGKELLKKTFYPVDIINGTKPTIQVKDFTSLSNTLLSKNCINPVIAEEQFLSNKYVKGVYNDYALTATNYPLLNKVYLSNNDLSYRNVYECKNFDLYGNPLFVTENETMNTVYIWGYNYLYPIAGIKNATFDQINAIVGASTLTSLATSNSPDMSKLDMLKNIANTFSTTYTYKPLVGLISKADPRGLTTNYEYDNYNRLYLVRDDSKNILAKYGYGYRPSEYTIPTATITPGASSYSFGATGVAFLSQVSGGSGSYTYSWYLKSASGSILASSVNTANTSFSFICSQAGTLSVQCMITDNQSGVISTISNNITVNIPPCTVSIQNQFSNAASSISCNGTTITLSLVFYSSCCRVEVGTSYYVGYVNAGCRPTVTQTKTLVTNGNTWNVTFNSNGGVYVMIVSGTAISPGQTIYPGQCSFGL